MFVRYDMPDVTGETREERNKRFKIPEATVDWDIPDDGMYLWGWYWRVSARKKRVSEGVAVPLEWNDFLAWAAATGEIVKPFEYDILADMDDAFVTETNAELSRSRAILKDQAEKDAKAAAKKRGK